MGNRYPLNFSSDELRTLCEERAEAKDISLNEWINRALAHAVTNAGTIRITTTVTREF